MLISNPRNFEIVIKLPPKVNLDPFKEIIEHHQHHLAAYIEMNQALDANGRYLLRQIAFQDSCRA